MSLLNRRPDSTPRDILIDPWIFNIVDSMEEFASMSVWMNGFVQEITPPTGFRALYQLSNFWNRLLVRVDDDYTIEGGPGTPQRLALNDLPELDE